MLLFSLDETIHNIKVSTELLVEPTWPIWENISVFSPSCTISQEGGTNGTVIFQGSSEDTCSIQTIAGMISRTTLVLAEVSEGKNSSLVYVERLSDIESSECTNRFVLIDSQQAVNCSITFDGRKS